MCSIRNYLVDTSGNEPIHCGLCFLLLILSVYEFLLAFIDIQVIDIFMTPSLGTMLFWLRLCFQCIYNYSLRHFNNAYIKTLWDSLSSPSMMLSIEFFLIQTKMKSDWNIHFAHFVLQLSILYKLFLVASPDPIIAYTQVIKPYYWHRGRYSQLYFYTPGTLEKEWTPYSQPITPPGRLGAYPYILYCLHGNLTIQCPWTLYDEFTLKYLFNVIFHVVVLW